MNSGIQCLSNCDSIRGFFLDKAYREQINAKNSLGTRGKTAEIFYGVLSELWGEGPGPVSAKFLI